MRAQLPLSNRHTPPGQSSWASQLVVPLLLLALLLVVAPLPDAPAPPPPSMTALPLQAANAVSGRMTQSALITMQV
jgi:hypothetical protein